MVSENAPETEIKILPGINSGFLYQQNTRRDTFDAYNDFDAPETVKIRAMDGITEENGVYSFTLPACSVVELTVC